MADLFEYLALAGDLAARRGERQVTPRPVTLAPMDACDIAEPEGPDD